MKPRFRLLGLAALAVTLPPPAASLAAPKPAPAKAAPVKAPATPDPLISTGKEAILADHVVAEKTTVVLFYQPGHLLDSELLEAVRKRAEGDPRLVLRLVRLPSTDAPIAKQYEVEETPLAFVYDRNKNLVGKGKTLDELIPLVSRSVRTARIKWVDEQDPTAGEVYRIFGGGRQPVPEIMKTLSLHPELMEAIAQIAGRYHFADGYLDRRTKEMIASYVSALNRCKY
ncbi:MAG TPA: carboxymuconolactone decarboxylase family protein [Armatimonadota bacterium]|nr:carboxymuconolactone decarboxylase family protein [Armatimonadota bacterium]